MLEAKQRTLLETLGILLACFCIIVGSAVILTSLTLGPFWLLLMALIVPIALVPCLIILSRLIPSLLTQYGLLKPQSEKEALQHESFRQKLSVQLETSIGGVLWVRIYHKLYYFRYLDLFRWDFKLL